MPLLPAIAIGTVLLALATAFAWGPLNSYFVSTESTIPKVVYGAPTLEDHLQGMDFEHRSLSSGEIIPGPLFKNGQVHVNDEMLIRLSFNKPVYCFLFSINPDGSTQLCYPEELPDLVQQQPVSTVVYPKDSTYGYAFTEGAGQVAFIVVKSEAPLPSFNEWISNQKDLVEPVLETKGSWIWNGSKFTLVNELDGIPSPSKTRGKSKLTTPLELESRIREISKDRALEIRTLTFPVISSF